MYFVFFFIDYTAHVAQNKLRKKKEDLTIYIIMYCSRYKNVLVHLNFPTARGRRRSDWRFDEDLLVIYLDTSRVSAALLLSFRY